MHIIVPRSIPKEYILISPAYCADTGNISVKKENQKPTFSPKSLRMCVYPSIAVNAIVIAENNL